MNLKLEPPVRLFFGRIYCCLPLVLLPFVLFLSGTSPAAAQCGVTPTRSGNTFSNNTSLGSFAWSSISNLSLSDNGRASNGVLLGVLASQNTNYIVVQNFGFGIPPGAAVCGIEVMVERRATGLLIGSSIRDNSVRLIKNNVISGTDMASGANWPGSDRTQVYGSVNQTWGNTWTPEDINAADFGVAISARLSAGLASLFLTAEIDQVTMRVFYNLVLPVKLLSFKATPHENTVSLEWSTASGNSNDHFVVERSANGTSGWEPIDSVAGFENSNALHNYYAKDKNPLSVNYYRLRQMNRDGSKTFSNIVKAQVHKISTDLQVFPNLVRSHSEITALFPGQVKQVLLKTPGGKEIRLDNFYALAQGIKLKLPGLKNGYYWIVIQTSQNVYTKKVLVWSN